MCTVDEVRRVVKQELRNEAPSKLPAVLLNFGVYGMIAILGWLLYDAHLTSTQYAEQDKITIQKTSDREKEMVQKIADRERVTLLAIAGLTRQVDSLLTNFKHLKEATISGTADRWYRRDALARINLEDERFKARNALLKEQFNTTHRRHDMSQERQNRTDGRLNSIEKSIKEHHDGKDLQ